MSTPEMEPCIKLPMENNLYEEIVSKAKDWAIMHGAAMRSKKAFDPDSVFFAPFTLIPSTFPTSEFNKAVNLQTILNELIHKVAHDHEFLYDTLKRTVEVDEFTGRLYKIYQQVREEGITQALSLGLLRGDYLIDAPDAYRIKQVEINTVATSLSGLSTQISRVHRFVLNELGHTDLQKSLPENLALSGLCGGMVAAWRMYNVPNAYLLFVVEDVTYNICDQRFHEFFIRESHPELKIIRRTFSDISKRGRLDNDKKLFVDDIEIAVVYYRTGYEPQQYADESEWAARLLMERSLAIKCPSIQYHLAGTKKVQQVLALPGVLERFITNSDQVAKVREIFTGIFSLDEDLEGDKAAQMALKNPERYVLKPQREGGGNNVYGAAVADKIQEMLNSKERSGWILMERICPPVQKTYVIRPGSTAKSTDLQDVVSELGIFGVILGDSKQIYLNQQKGHMLRTKLSSADEGGVAAGAGCLDSPFLVS